MTTRQVVAVLVFLLLPAPARAHKHTREASAAPFSLAKGSNLWGTHASVGFTLPRTRPSRDSSTGPTKATGPLTVFFDVGFHSGAHHGAHRSQLALAGGLRLQRRLAKHLHPFGQLLLAGVRTRDEATDVSDWAWGPGGGFGLDYCFGPRQAACARAQFDYAALTWSDEVVRKYARYSAGLLVRWGEHN